MKIKLYLIIPFLLGCLFINGLEPALAGDEDIAPLLEKITNRLNSYSDNSNWTYRIVNRITEMDKKWRPKKTTITTAIVKDANNMLTGELIKAEEIEDGITRDVTQKLAEQTKEQIESANKERAKNKDQEDTEDSSEAFLPFGENKKVKFKFNRLDDTTINKIPVYVIEAVAKEKDDQLFEGKYYIDRNTYDVLKARIKPSKKPRLVKELDMDIDFEVLPEGKFIRRRSRTRVNAGIIFKRFRAIIEEEYSDIKILD
ncbi:hypothetical protein ACFL1N_02820 [Thermodesulfobacteriota bacterium]